jgi:acyl-CoA synthetase (AMP-forming)/AMP-acid ligase II
MLLQREAVTLFRGWPAQAENLARESGSGQLKLPALRSGSLEALLPPGLRSEPGARASLFGMTETFGPYCGYRADTDMPRTAWGSCGQPFPGMDIRIVDPLTSAVLPPGHVGAVEVRGSHVMRGMCRRTREELFTSDGYYRTGDRGHLDADGFLFFHGRADDMFKVSGATVYPSEVAAALRTIPGVVTAYVTNLPDGQRNRVAAVVIGDAVTINVNDLLAEARRRLSAFKVPTIWLSVAEDNIPRGATGKVDPAALRAVLSHRGVCID